MKLFVVTLRFQPTTHGGDLGKENTHARPIARASGYFDIVYLRGTFNDD